MALPHYKLQKQMVEKTAPEDFPYLLVPADTAPTSARVRDFFYSKSFTVILVLAIVTALAGLIWQCVDPQTTFNYDLLKNPIIIACAATFIFGLLGILMITRQKKKQAYFVATPKTIRVSEAKPLSLVRVLELPAPANTVVEWRCEEWNSAPFIEVLEETVIAEVFSDEMIAPDHLIFSFEVEEKK